MCPLDDAGLCGGSGPTEVLPAIPSGVGEAREQTSAVGEDESAVLCLCPRVDAAPVRSPVLRREAVNADFCIDFLLIIALPKCRPSMRETTSCRLGETAS